VAEVEDSEEEVSMVVDLEVEVEASTVAALEADTSEAAVFILGALPQSTAAVLAESVAAVGELALAYRTPQVAFKTLPAQGLGSLPLVIHHPDTLCMMVDLLDPLLLASGPIVARWLQSPVHRKHFRNAE
jgi:hypothetical protein